MLDLYFSNKKLKAILSLPLLGNGGLSASKISAFTAVKIYKEFMLDGGYYPEGGMQKLPDVLMNRIKELGGEVILSCKVERIRLSNDEVVAVIDEKHKNYFIPKYLVSNVDVFQTFRVLLGKNKISNKLSEKIDNMIPSLSMLILYLGVDPKRCFLPQNGTNVWFLPYYNVERMYSLAEKNDIENLKWFLARLLPDNKSVLAMMNVPFKNKKFWKEQTQIMTNNFIKRIEKVIPGLSSSILFKSTATPVTLYEYTLNYKGAAYGWASNPAQFLDSDFSQAQIIKNLFLTGHWTTQAQGVSGVAYSGYKVAKLILKKVSK